MPLQASTMPTNPPPPRSPSMPQGDPLGDSPLPNCPIRDVVLTEHDTQLFAELHRASAMTIPRCVSRYATARAECFEGALTGHESCADFAAVYC